MKIRVAIFASGNGTNAEAILQYFKNHDRIGVECLLTNNPRAYVIERARKWDKSCYIFSRDQLYKSEDVINYLEEKRIDIIVLAGFLWLVPISIIEKIPIILNIHPALLPKYGGKGMYGARVHQQVLENKDPFTGITIHYVNKEYDEGDIIFQKKCEVLPTDTIKDIERKVHELEHEYYPEVIEKIAGKTFKKS